MTTVLSFGTFSVDTASRSRLFVTRRMESASKSGLVFVKEEPVDDSEGSDGRGSCGMKDSHNRRLISVATHVDKEVDGRDLVVVVRAPFIDVTRPPKL